MNENRWYKTDNVAKVFLATYNARDTRCMRLSCTLNEEIDEEKLQEALDRTIAIRPQFQVRIRRGFFWHYVEETQYQPKVVKETGRPCPLLYGKYYGGVLHYRVSYFDCRINLDIFHALSDGTGAMEFLNVLVWQYIRLAHPEDGVLDELKIGSGASEADLNQNSFSQFYSRGKDIKNANDKEKTRDTATAVNEDDENTGKKGKNDKFHLQSYHYNGMRLPYDQLQFLEVSMNAADILPKAKELGVTLGSYMGARIMLSLYKSMPYLKQRLPITASMPVNLRNFYNSETSRNFFNSVTISHKFDGSETLEELAKEYDRKLKESITPEAVRKKMQGFQKLERIFFVRMVPLFLKQPILRYVSKAENENVSFVLSNMGIMRPDKELQKYISGYSAFCSHEEIFMTCFSYNGIFKLGISHCYQDTAFLKDLVRDLTNDGIEVTVNATEVIR